MTTSQTVVSREVRHFMVDQGITQAGLAERLDLSQGKVSKRLRGITRWSLEDLDKLWDMGVPISLPAMADWGGDER